MSALLTYFKSNVGNVIGVVFVVLTFFFGARIEPLKEPTVSLLTAVVNLLVPAETEVETVELAKDTVAIVPATTSAAGDEPVSE